MLTSLWNTHEFTEKCLLLGVTCNVNSYATSSTNFCMAEIFIHLKYVWENFLNTSITHWNLMCFVLVHEYLQYNHSADFVATSCTWLLCVNIQVLSNCRPHVSHRSICGGPWTLQQRIHFVIGTLQDVYGGVEDLLLSVPKYTVV